MAVLAASPVAPGFRRRAVEPGRCRPVAGRLVVQAACVGRRPAAAWTPPPLLQPPAIAAWASSAAAAAVVAAAARGCGARRRGVALLAAAAADAAAPEGAATEGGLPAGSALEQLEQLRRSDEDADRVWAAYCQRKGAGETDPAAHPEAFVERFVRLFGGERCTEDVVAQLIPLVSGDTNTAGRWKSYCMEEGIGVDDPRMLSKSFVASFVEQFAEVVRDDLATEELLARVTAMTDADQEAAQLWSAYKALLGDRPLSAGLVQAFLGHYAPGKASAEAVERLQSLIAGSPSTRLSWGQYCRQEGIGIFDSTLLPAYFVDRFLEACDAGCLPAVEMASEELASLVGGARASGADQEDAWVSCCREEGDGSPDPLHHSKGFVEAFLERQPATTS